MRRQPLVSRRKFSKCRRTGKLRYHDKLEAEIELAKLVWKDKGEKRTYRCHYCHGFHTTSQAQRTELKTA